MILQKVLLELFFLPLLGEWEKQYIHLLELYRKNAARLI